jgi:RHH-type transcriptional regulator, proline utilization regulon repressor / proline dehydrogenase / delta 1-pyrroline-5-carboxylate dehydrogenase
VRGLREGVTLSGHASAKQSGRASRVQSLMQEYALSSEEGVALMCLAEALLRIPDAATRDALIRDKIGQGDWQQHLGRSDSLFVNAASWGLLLTGKLVATHSEGHLMASLARLLGKGGEPVIRKSVDLAMRMLGEQFVTGQTIGQALKRAREMESRGFRYSYDMLGEAALTDEDAQRYYAAYEQAIHAIGQAAQGESVIERAGISIKLSALHPRYSRAQQARVMQELLPRVLKLTELAKHYNIGLNIDAEEAERLDISLDLLEALCHAPSLAGWHGIGFVIQAYQKRCPFVIDFIIDLAQRTQHRLMIRLVKGAYWDSEIKRAQMDGQSDYPVYTRKHHTDVAYLACARKLLAAPDSVYPQFATHNAQTLAAIVQLAQAQLGDFALGQYEFQCLHGMGEPLYLQVVGAENLNRPCRIYAPVGTHETLLAYLVRRLLENGANSSFVNRMADEGVSVDDLIQDPVQRMEEDAGGEDRAGSRGATRALSFGASLGFGAPHPQIPLPAALYGAARVNSQGLDLSDEPTLRQLVQQMQQMQQDGELLQVKPMLAGSAKNSANSGANSGINQSSAALPLINPADHSDRLGSVLQASSDDVETALQAAHAYAATWAAVPPAQRAAMLEQAAHLLQGDMPRCMALLVREAGKTWAHAIAEVREAIDFLRYYAAQVRRDFDGSSHVPLGPVVCISPWNFPLAIFLGQVAAALAAGNTVLAKPAEATPAIAALAVQTLWQAGVPREAVQLLPGQGREVGMQLVSDARVQGVMFTGSTATARVLQKALAQRLNAQGQIVPLIAETGGQNCMVVDSSALLEQVVQDAMASAFEAAGQRCSALRVLCVQEEVADRLIEMLQGAMREIRLGTPAQLHTDVGPVIDARAQNGIEAHIAAMQAKGRKVHRLHHEASSLQPGTYVVPTLIELESISELSQEIFGPVLHVVRYRRAALDQLMAQINATGFALTFGVHSRIDETIAQATALSHAGNVYVNRNMVGAVVGLQPFGGDGLSGTGPKAGGPLYLLRLLARSPQDAALRSVQACGAAALPQATPALQALHDWAVAQHQIALAHLCARLAACSPAGLQAVLPGPTGERNVYRIQARERVLSLTGMSAGAEQDRLNQLAAILAVGSRAVWPQEAQALSLYQRMPQIVQAQIDCVADILQAEALVDVQVALLHGDEASSLQAAQMLSQRPGPIISLTALRSGDEAVALARLVCERSVSINTAAAGGNASLMTLQS